MSITDAYGVGVAGTMGIFEAANRFGYVRTIGKCHRRSIFPRPLRSHRETPASLIAHLVLLAGCPLMLVLADKASTYLNIPSVVTAVVLSGTGWKTVYMYVCVGQITSTTSRPADGGRCLFGLLFNCYSPEVTFSVT